MKSNSAGSGKSRLIDGAPKKNLDTPSSADFNRTVVISKPHQNGSSHATPLHKITTRFARKKQEVEDIIGGWIIRRSFPFTD